MKIYTERENFRIFWTTWTVSIKSQKNKTSLTLSLENTNLEKVTTTFKIWSKATLSEISKFSILGIEQNRKLENLGNYNSIQNLKQKNCPRVPRFRFWEEGKLSFLKMFFFMLKLRSFLLHWKVMFRSWDQLRHFRQSLTIGLLLIWEKEHIFSFSWLPRRWI